MKHFVKNIYFLRIMFLHEENFNERIFPLHKCQTISGIPPKFRFFFKITRIFLDNVYTLSTFRGLTSLVERVFIYYISRFSPNFILIVWVQYFKKAKILALEIILLLKILVRKIQKILIFPTKIRERKIKNLIQKNSFWKRFLSKILSKICSAR